MVIASAGCVLNRTPLIPGQDTGALDTGRIDTGSFDGGNFDGGRDAGMDAPVPDVPGLDTGIDTGVDAGMDAGMDAGVDTGVDAGVDTGVDAGMPDTGVDAGMPDTGVDAPVTRRTCEEIFGTAAAFVDCTGPTSTGTTCEFYTNPSGGDESCNNVCASFGGTCSATYANGSAGFRCTRIGGGSCSSTYNDMICVCNRP